MAGKIAVAWLERPSLRKRWCRAATKTTTIYQDSVRTACDHYVILPADFSHEALVDCEICKGEVR